MDDYCAAMFGLVPCQWRRRRIRRDQLLWWECENCHRRTWLDPRGQR